jgi:hypothetical protein
MDASTAAAAAAPTGLLGWIMANGQMVAFIGQLLYWLVLAVASIWAVAVFNRYVNFMMRDSATAQMPAAEGTASADEPVSVEEFVE